MLTGMSQSIQEVNGIEVDNVGTSLAVQQLGLRALTAEGPGSIPGQGTKIPQAARHSQKKKKEVDNVNAIGSQRC